MAIPIMTPIGESVMLARGAMKLAGMANSMASAITPSLDQSKGPAFRTRSVTSVVAAVVLATVAGLTIAHGARLAITIWLMAASIAIGWQAPMAIVAVAVAVAPFDRAMLVTPAKVLYLSDVAFIGAVAGLIRLAGVTLPRPSRGIALGLFALWLLALPSVVVAHDRAFSFAAWLALTKVTVILLTVLHASAWQPQRTRQYLIGGVVVAALSAIATGAMNLVNPSSLLRPPADLFPTPVAQWPVYYVTLGATRLARVRGFLGDPNSFAAFCDLLIPVVLFAMSRYRRSMLGLAVLLMAIAVTALSRSSFVALTLTIGYLTLGTNRRGTAIGFIAVLLAIILASGLGRAIGSRAASIGDPTYVPNAARLELYQHAISVWRSAPIVGIGMNGFELVSQRVAIQGFGYGATLSTHNVPLEILVGTGIVGAAGWVLLIMAWWRSLRPLPPGSARTASVIAMIVLGVHSMTDSFLRSYPMLLMGLLVCTYPAILAARRKGPTDA